MLSQQTAGHAAGAVLCDCCRKRIIGSHDQSVCHVAMALLGIRAGMMDRRREKWRLALLAYLLLDHRGNTSAEVAAVVGYSERSVRRWRRGVAVGRGASTPPYARPLVCAFQTHISTDAGRSLHEKLAGEGPPPAIDRETLLTYYHALGGR